MKREIVSIAVMLMLFVSMFLSLPLVSAAYTVEYPYMPPDLEGDVNNDGMVDMADISIVIDAFGSKPGDPNWDPRADVNNDGTVDMVDVTIVIDNFIESEGNPVAYSTTFEFTVPNDGNKEVWYYILAKVYVPPELSGQNFYFVASADDSVQNVKLDDVSKAGSGSSVNIDLGSLNSGYHLLEFEFVETIAAGVLNFHVATTAEEYAWLTRFRIYVPNYSDNPYEYTVTTTTNFPIDDDYFLKGYADDYIDDLYVDGLKWQDWEWNCTPYDTIYAWGDGFCYPLGERLGWREITFTFGEIWLAGLLDFQIVSWTRQRDRIGNPRFRAVGNLNPADYITISDAMFYGGSEWKFEDDPEFSERYFEARQMINARYDDGETWFNTSLEIGLGLGWAEWALLPATEDDVGITLNFTAKNFQTNRRDHMDMGFWCELDLENPTIDIYSFPALEIDGIEYEEHDSFVKPDLTSAIDYTGTVIMFVSSTIVGGAQGLLGATVGLGIKGLAAAIRITEGQPVSRFEQKITDDHHYQVLRNYDLDVGSPPEGEIRATSDIIFFKLDPVAGKHCGLTKVVLHGILVAEQWFIGGPGTGPLRVWSAPIANIEISIYIPWFLRG